MTVSLLSALESIGMGDHVHRIDHKVIDYADELDGQEETPGVRALLQPTPEWRGSRVPMGVVNHVCRSHCQEQGPVDWLVTRTFRGVTYAETAIKAYRRWWMKDVERYLTREGPRAKVLQKVRNDLLSFRPHIVIGHSLGSVVTLDVLAVPGTPQPIALITVGAPIGLPEIRRRQLPEATRAWLAAPQSAWLNVHDPRDFVTGGRRITSWPGGSVTAIVNLEVDNDQGHLRERVTHKLGPYLAHPPVARFLALLADRPSMSPTEAHATLIDALDQSGCGPRKRRSKPSIRRKDRQSPL